MARTLVVWTEHETVTVVVRAYEISQRAQLNVVGLFNQAQRETLRLDRHRKISNIGNLGDYVVTMWRELNSFTEEQAASYVAAWNGKKIPASFDARPRGRAAAMLPPVTVELPKFGWDWGKENTVTAVNEEVDHSDLHRLAQEALAAEAQQTPTAGAEDEEQDEDPDEVPPVEPPAPTPPATTAESVVSVAISESVRNTFVSALTDLVRHLVHRDIDHAVRTVVHEIGETHVRPIVKPIIAGIVQEEVLPLVHETVATGLNNALTDMSSTLRRELNTLTDPSAPQPEQKAAEDAKPAEEDTSVLHHIVIFGLQADEFMRAVSVVMPFNKSRAEVHHAKDLRQVHHHLRPDTKLIHMIKMSAHLSSDIKAMVGRTYPVNGGVSEAKKVLLDIVNGTNLMPSY